MSRYAPKGASKGAHTYYVLEHTGLFAGTTFKAYDSSSSELVASAETLEELTDKCDYLGYRKEDIA